MLIFLMYCFTNFLIFATCLCVYNLYKNYKLKVQQAECERILNLRSWETKLTAESGHRSKYKNTPPFRKSGFMPLSSNMAASISKLNEPIWFWINKRGFPEKIDKNISKEIEEEYQSHYNKTKTDLRVYHCFDDGRTAIINFDRMETSCGSAKCQICFTDRGHMTFKLLRETPESLSYTFSGTVPNQWEWLYMGVWYPVEDSEKIEKAFQIYLTNNANSNYAYNLDNKKDKVHVDFVSKQTTCATKNCSRCQINPTHRTFDLRRI